MLAKAAPVEDGIARVTWRVPRDQALSDAYVLVARSVPAGLAETQARVCWPLRPRAPGLTRAAQITGVKVVRPRSRLVVTRIGHAEVEVRRPAKRWHTY